MRCGAYLKPRNPNASVDVQAFGLSSTDHNLMVQGKFVFQANYTSGLHIFRVDTPSLISHVGWFDTHPQNNGPGFNGAWGVYTKLPSGNILLSDIQNGLFILDASAATANPGALPAVSWPGMIALVILVIAAFRSGIRQNSATDVGAPRNFHKFRYRCGVGNFTDSATD